MAIRTFNSVAGFSVGEIPTTIVTSTGNVTTGNLLTDNLLHANGVAWSFGTASGAAGYIQFGDGTNLTGNANLQFDNANANLNVIGNINVGSGNNIKLYGNGAISAGAISATDATFSGNLTVSGTTTFVNTTSTSIKDPLITLGGDSAGGNATSYDAKDRGLVLDNYTTGLGAGPLNQALIWKTANSQFEVGSNISVTDNVVTVNEYGNMKAGTFIGNVSATNISGTLTTASQPNITSVGILTSANVSGLANVNQLQVGGVIYPNVAGLDGQYIKTYANGTLYYGSLDTSKVANGTTEIDLFLNGNINFNAGGVSNVVVISSTGASVTGNISVSSNVSVTNTLSANIINANTANVTSVIIGNSSIWSTTVTTSSLTATTLVTLDVGAFRAVEFIIKGESTIASKYSVATILAVHDGSTPTNIDFTTYGTINLGGTTGTFSMTSDTTHVYLKVTPSTTSSIVWTTQYRLI
jgi:hypothetical protein